MVTRVVPAFLIQPPRRRFENQSTQVKMISGVEQDVSTVTYIRVKDVYELPTIAVESSDPFCSHASQLKLGVPTHILLLEYWRRPSKGEQRLRYARDTDRGD